MGAFIDMGRSLPERGEQVCSGGSQRQPWGDNMQPRRRCRSGGLECQAVRLERSLMVAIHSLLSFN